MNSSMDWLIPLFVGVTFLTVGSLKLYGVIRGITGGADKPVLEKLCGS
jgi:hypothetical protein